MSSGAIKFCRRVLLNTLLICGLYSLVLASTPSVNAAAGINQQINFQGRLLNAQGATVPDGFYNIEFKIYQDGDGLTAADATGSPSGSLKWTEDYLNNASHGVTVKNGFLSVQLGSINAFGGSIDWNQDTLWLSMNIAGTASCTPFSSCSPDGEMLPMKRLSANAYSLNSAMLNGLSSSQFIQLAQGVQTDTTSVSSLFVNKTGASGNLLQLQSGSADKFVVGYSGNVTAVGVNSGSGLLQGTGGLTIAGTTAINTTTGNGNTSIGNSTGTLALTSTGLNVSTAGVLSGITGLTQNSGTFAVTSTGLNVTSAGVLSGITGYTQNSGSYALTSTGLSVTAAGVLSGVTGYTQTSGNFGISGSGTFSTGTGTIALNGATTVSSTLVVQGANALTLGTTGTNTGAILFKGATAASGTLTLAGPSNPNTFTLSIPAITSNANVCTDNAVCTGYAPSATNGYVAIAPSGVQGDTTTNSTIFINKSAGSGNLLELQSGAADKFVVGFSGDVTAGKFNTNTLSSTALTFTGATPVISASTTNTGLTLQANGSGTLTLNTSGAGTINLGATATTLGIGNGSSTNTITGTTNNINGNTNINTATTASTSVGNTTGTFALLSPNITISSGAIGGVTGYTQASGNFGISGSGTFGTGSGAISLNGDTTIAANKSLTLTSGTGSIVQTYSSTAVGSAQTIGVANANSGAGIAIQGINLTPTNNGAPSSGTNVVNVINLAAGTNSGITNGINFASATGYTNFIKSPSLVVTSAGVLSGLTGYSQTTGDLAYSGGGNFSIASSGLSVTTGGAVSGITGYTQTSGNFGISGTGTFGTGTGAISLNGATTVSTTLAVSGANAVTLGTTGTNTGAILFKGATAASGTLTLAGPSNPNTFTLTIPTITGNANVCTDNAVCTGYAPSLAGGYVAIGPAAAQSDTTSNTSIFINKSTGGGGNLIDLQVSSGDKFLVNNSGDVAAGKFNTDTLTSTALTFTGVTPVISASTTNTGLALQANGTGTLTLDTTGAGTINLGAAATTLGIGNGSSINTITGTTNNINGNTNINVGNTASTAIGNTTGTFALLSPNITISSGAIGGATGYTQASGNFGISGGGTFGTGTGAISLNGDVTVAANKSLALTSGTGTIVQTYTNTVASSANSLNVTNANSGSGIAIQGLNLAPTNTATASSGTNTLNVINLAAGGALGGTDTTNGINFASATGYTNFIKTPTLNVTSAGVLSGLTGYSQTSGDLAYSGGGNFSIASSGLSVTTAGILSGITGYTQTSGNFGISGSGTFGTGTGAISLNGATTVSTTLGVSGANALTLGTTGTNTGVVLFKGATGASGTLTLAGPSNPGATTTLNIPAVTGTTATICTDQTVCTGYAPSATNGYVAIAPAGVQGDTTTNSTIFINKSAGSGNLIELQSGAADKFVVGFAGDVTAGKFNTDTLTSTALTFTGAAPIISASTTNTSLTLQANGSGTLTLNTTGAGTINLGTTGGATVIGIGSASSTNTITGTANNINGNTNINTGTTNNTSIGNTTGTFAVSSPNITIASGAIGGVTGYTQASGNFGISGGGTFGTGTGAISLNGDTTIIANKSIALTSGTGTIVQTYTNTVAGSANSLNVTNANSGAGIAIQGLNLTPTNTATPSSGSNILNVINLAAGTNSNTTNGINFASATGYSNFIASPSLNVTSAGVLSGLTGFTETSGNFAYSGGGNFSVASAGLSVTTGGAISGITGYTQASGNFGISGSGTFSTGTGTVGLNGATTVSSTLIVQGVNALTLGVTGTATGAVLFKGATGASGTLTLLGPANPGATTTLNIPAVTGTTATICTDQTVCTGYAPSATNGYVAIAPAGVQGDTTTNSSIFINKSGASGNLLELQSGAADKFVVGFAGAVTAASTIQGTSLDGTTGINTGAAGGTQRIDVSGNLVAIGNITTTGASTFSTGANSLTVTSSNFNVSSVGVVTLAGAQTADITTLASGAGTATAITLQTGLSGIASGTGASVTIKAGNQSGTTTSVGGTLALQGGNTTGVSGTRTGGNVTIDAGTGGTTNGNVNIGATTSVTTTIQGATSIALNSATIVGNQAAQTLFNTVATSANIFGAATGTIAYGGAAGNTTFGNTGAYTLQGVSGQAFSVNAQGAATLSLDTGSTGTVGVGTSAVAKTINIGQTGATAVTQNIFLGNSTSGATSNVTIGNATSGTTTIQGGTAISLSNNTTVTGTNTFTVNAGATQLTGAAAGSANAVKISTGATSNVGLMIQGIASQTAALLKLQDSTNSNLNVFDNAGNYEQLGYLSTPFGGIGNFGNLLVQSEAFDNASWVKASVTTPTANTVVSPDGTTSAESLADSGSGGSVAQTSSTAPTNTNYTFSVWLKAASTQTVDLRIDGATTGTGTKATVTATTTWQRFTVTQNPNGFTGNIKVVIFPGTTAASGTVSAWGAQLVLGSTAQVYVATNASTVAATTGFAANGNAIFQSSTNSTSAFLVQNSSSFNVLSVDTSGNQVKIFDGTATQSYLSLAYNDGTTTGTLSVSGGTTAIGTGTGPITVVSGSAASVTITANAASTWKTNTGTLTLQSGTSSDLILTPGSSQVTISGSSVLKLGSGTTDPTCTVGAVVYNSTSGTLRGCQGGTPAWFDLVNVTPDTLQATYTASTGGSTPEIKVDSTRGALDIQDANSTIGADLLDVRASNAGALGTILFGVGSTGTTTIQSSAGLTLFTASAAGSDIQIGNGTTHSTNPITLTLDNYLPTTAGSEPTYSDGAMYYDADNALFRCGLNGYWQSCALNNIQAAYDFEDDFISGGTTNGTIGNMNWGYSQSATACAAPVYNSLAANHDHPGVLSLNSAASGATCMLRQGTSNTTILAAGDAIRATVQVDATTSNRMMVGVANWPTTPVTNQEPNGTSSSGVWWEAVAGTANWEYCYGNFGTATCSTGGATTPAVAAGAWVQLEIHVISTGAGTSAVDFVANGVNHQVSGVTIDFGSTTASHQLTPGVYANSTTATARNYYIDYFQWTGAITTAGGR